MPRDLRPHPARQADPVSGKAAPGQGQVFMLTVMLGILMLAERLFDHGLLLRQIAVPMFCMAALCHAAPTGAMHVLALGVVVAFDAVMNGPGMNRRAILVVVGYPPVNVVNRVTAMFVVVNDPAVRMMLDIDDMVTMRVDLGHLAAACRVVDRRTVVMVVRHVAVRMLDAHPAMRVMMHDAAAGVPFGAHNMMAMGVMMHLAAGCIVAGGLFSELLRLGDAARAARRLVPGERRLAAALARWPG